MSVDLYYVVGNYFYGKGSAPGELERRLSLYLQTSFSETKIYLLVSTGSFKRMQTPKNALIIYSPQELVKKSGHWEKRDIFYMNAPGTTYSFGVPLWAAAYEECRGHEEGMHKGRENFPFILDVENYPGFVLSGLALGIKFFLFRGEEKVFKNLQDIVRKKGGNMWH